MNLIQTPEVYTKTDKDKDFYFMHEWRAVDFDKIEMFIKEIYSKTKMIDDAFEYKVTKQQYTTTYRGDFASFYDLYQIDQRYEGFEKNIEFLVPKLMYNNYFILNKTVYVPLLFLEKTPIDQVKNVKDGKIKDYKIYANLNPVYNFTFDFVNNIVFFKSKKTDFNLFFKIIFEKDDEKLKKLLELGLITDTKIINADREAFIKFLGFHRKDYFKGVNIVQFIDDVFMFEHYKEVFNDYYGIRTIKEIVWKIVEMFESRVEVDMADIKNRKLIMIDYLIKPLFDMYIRLIYGLIEKKNAKFLSSVNKNTVLSKGFRDLMHGGNLYDISLPYPSPLIHKVSQDISIIKDGRLPKSWIRNDESAYGISCPVSVSASKTASNIIFTTDAMVNKYGRIKLRGE